LANGQNPMDRLGSKPVVDYQFQRRSQGISPGREQGVKNRVSKLSRDREQEQGKQPIKQD